MKRFWVALLTAFVCLGLSLSYAWAESSQSSALTIMYQDNAVESLIAFRGEQIKLAYALANEDDTEKPAVTWTTSDKSVAAVAKGVVTTKAAGEATITCSAELADGTTLQASVCVAVKIPVKTVQLSQSKITLNVGEASEEITAELKPTDASCLTLAWSSEDEMIAVVDSHGVITAVKAGKTTITATSAEGSEKPASKSLTVTSLQPMETLTFADASGEVGVSKTLQLSPTILPEDTSNTAMTWTSSDSTVAVVDKKGLVTGKRVGTAVITCAAKENESICATYAVEVFAPAKTLALDSKTVTLYVDDGTVALTATVSPESAKYQNVTWSSSDESIATVDTDGVISPVSAGKVTITAVSAEPLSVKGKAKSASCTVTVKQYVTGITLSADEKTVAKGKTLKLTAELLPENATDKSLTWESSDAKIASVSKGTVTGKGVGTTMITCASADGSAVSATWEVTVYQDVVSVKAAQSKVSVTKGKAVTLSATVSPADATNPTLKWSSGDTSIATVNAATGTVTAESVGVCTIYATAADGSEKKAQIKLTVEPVVPLSAEVFSQSGYFGYYYEFAVTFKNLTKTRTIKYIDFDVKYLYLGQTYSLTNCYTDSDTIRAGQKKKVGWWDQLGYKLSYCSNFRIYLNMVKYSDGTYEYFSDNPLIGSFY